MVPRHRTRRLLSALGVAALCIPPLFVALASDHNGLWTCDLAYVPVDPAGESVQIRYSVSLVPLNLRCDYTKDFRSADPDWTSVDHDLGTALWLAPIGAVVAAVGAEMLARRRRDEITSKV